MAGRTDSLAKPVPPPPEKALATPRRRVCLRHCAQPGAWFGSQTVSGSLPSHKVLQDGALPCTLAAHHSDLGQVKVADMPHAAQGVLQTVDQRDQILHPLVAHRNGAATLPAPLPHLRVFFIHSVLSRFTSPRRRNDHPHN